MDNENQTPETPAQTQTQAQTQEPADWRQALSDSIRDAEEFKGIKSVEELANNYIAAKRFAVSGDLTPKTPQEEDAFLPRSDVPPKQKTIRSLCRKNWQRMKTSKRCLKS